MSDSAELPQKPPKKQYHEIIEKTPVILGGSPTDPQNKATVTREQHIQIVRYWNKIISDLRKNDSP